MEMIIAILFTVLSVVFLFIAINHSVEDGEQASRGIFIGIILAFNVMVAVAYWGQVAELIHGPFEQEIEELSRNTKVVELDIESMSSRELLKRQDKSLKEGYCLEKIDSTDTDGGIKLIFKER